MYAKLGQFPCGWITEVAWSPDGTILAVSNATDLSLYLFTGLHAQRQSLVGHTEPVRTVHFSPDAQWVATGSDDETVRVWSLGEKKHCIVIEAGDEVQQVRYRPDGQAIAATVQDTVKLWHTADHFGTATVLRAHTGNVTTIAWHGENMASAGWDKTIILWENNAPLRTLIGHTERINNVRFSGDGSRLFSVARDGTLRLWDVASGEEIMQLAAHASAPIDAVTLSPDASMLATGGRDLIIRLWNPNTLEPIGSIEGHTRPVLSIAFRPDGKWLATGGGDNFVRLWEL